MERVAEELAKLVQAPRPRKFTVELDFTEMIERLAMANGNGEKSLALLRRTIPWPEQMEERFSRLKGAQESLQRLEEEIDSCAGNGNLANSAEKLLRSLVDLRRQRAAALAEIGDLH